MLLIVAIPVFFILTASIVGMAISAPGYSGPSSDHFDGKQFINYDNVTAQGFSKVLKWMISRESGPWKKITQPPTTKPNTREDNLTVYFVNHSTFLVQWKGINFLTDPIWSERTSPFSFAGPARMRPPGIAFDDLPPIHLVLISHNHYDHMDLPTLQKLVERDDPAIILPLGVDLYLSGKDLNKSHALDWWQSKKYDSLDIVLVPAQHFSGRGMLDRDRTLWGGFMITDSIQTLYFAGDTGYNEKMFDDIATRHPRIDLALLPIGAYKPQWFMSPIHISPAEAVIIHKQLNIRKSVAMHYGTFPLADDGQEDPANDLLNALDKSGVSRDDFLLLKEGDKI